MRVKLRSKKKNETTTLTTTPTTTKDSTTTEDGGGWKTRVFSSIVEAALPTLPQADSEPQISISAPNNYRNAAVTGLFGIPLHRVMQDFPDFQIPPFVEKACLHIEEVLLDEEGIFRKSAPTEETKHYRNLLADGEQVELWYLESEVVCDLLKLYLRELPDPLLTFELYDCFLAQCQCAKQANAKLDLRKSIQLLPAVNKALLKRLVFCLRKVKLHSDKNRMNASNLGLIFGPNLLRAPNDREKHDMIADVPLVNAIALALIEDYDRLFSQVNYRPNYLCYARAWYDYTAASPSELSFSKGDVLLVMDKHSSGWWKGEKNGVVGYFPATYCAYLNGQMCGEKTNKNEAENEEDNEEDEWTKREMEILTDKERIQRAIAELSNSDEEERPGESAELLPAKSVVASSY